MKCVFSLEPSDLGAGKVIFQWSPKGNYMAVAGPKVREMFLDVERARQFFPYLELVSSYTIIACE